MNAWLATLAPFVQILLMRLGRASIEGGVALLLVWMLCRFAVRLPARVKSWLWRLAYVKLLAGLIWVTPLSLAILPQRATPPAATASAVLSAPAASEPPTDLQIVTDLPPSPTPVTGASKPNALYFILAAAWVCGIFGCLMVLCIRWIAIQRLRRDGAVASEESIRRACHALSARAGLRKPPKVVHSARVHSPVLVGILRPTIVLPVAAGAPADEVLQLILAHEIAHIRAHDLAWNLFTALMESLFFFHPVLWLARHGMRLTQELAADQQAVNLTRCEPIEYGRILVTVAANGVGRPYRLAALGVISSRNSLERRLIAMKNLPNWGRRGILASAIAVAFCAACVIPPWKLVAQTSANQSVAPADAKQSKAAGAAESGAAPSVTTEPTPERKFTFLANLSPSLIVHLQPRADGVVDFVNVKDGDVVNQGQVLVTLDQRRAQLEVALAQARLEVAVKQLSMRQLMLDKKIVSASEVEESQSEVQTNKLMVMKAQQDLEDLKLIASVAGVLQFEKPKTQPGELVKRGQTVATITAMGDLLAEFDVPTAQRAGIRRDQPVEITLAPNEGLHGKVLFVAPVANAMSRTVRVTASIANPLKRELAGATVQCTLTLPEREGAAKP